MISKLTFKEHWEYEPEYERELHQRNKFGRDWHTDSMKPMGVNRLIHEYLQDEKKTRHKMKTKDMPIFQGLSKEVNSAKHLERNSQKYQRKSENKSKEEQNFSRREF